MPFSTAVCNKVLDHIRGKTTFTLPAAFYVGLSSTTPTAAGTNITEPSTGAYARVAVVGGSYTAASAGSSTNNATITFPTSTASWGAALTYMVYYDASTAGNFLAYSPLTTLQTVGAAGITVSVPASNDTLTLS